MAKDDKPAKQASAKTLKLWYGVIVGIPLAMTLIGSLSYDISQWAFAVDGLLGIALLIGIFVVSGPFRKHVIAACLTLFGLQVFNMSNTTRLTPDSVKAERAKEHQAELAATQKSQEDEAKKKAAEDKKVEELKVKFTAESAKVEKSRVKRFGKFYEQYGVFRVYGVRGAKDDNRFEVTGYAVNISDKPISYAQIEVGFSDKAGARCGQAVSNVGDLGPGQPWKFKVVEYNEDAARYGITDLWGKGY
ncbi:MAG: FxLYD domain-containing protein [Candidatus Obscuribacterales bacterium]|nr:FxLYD domain-containing protein [Candidatus Obscuribacterales bacterium]